MEAGRIDPKAETTSNPVLRDSSRCSCLPVFPSTTVGCSWWQRIHSNHRHKPAWWVLAFLKIREWSEIVVGPRWKTFIRGFNRDQRLGRGWDDSAKFKYDHLSYYLSFDDSNNNNNDEDDEAGLGGFQSFSRRYASSSVHVASGQTPAVISVENVSGISLGGGGV